MPEIEMVPSLKPRATTGPTPSPTKDPVWGNIEFVSKTKPMPWEDTEGEAAAPSERNVVRDTVMGEWFRRIKTGWFPTEAESAERGYWASAFSKLQSIFVPFTPFAKDVIGGEWEDVKEQYEENDRKYGAQLRIAAKTGNISDWPKEMWSRWRPYITHEERKEGQPTGRIFQQRGEKLRNYLREEAKKLIRPPRERYDSNLKGLQNVLEIFEPAIPGFLTVKVIKKLSGPAKEAAKGLHKQDTDVIKSLSKSFPEINKESRGKMLNYLVTKDLAGLPTDIKAQVKILKTEKEVVGYVKDKLMGWREARKKMRKSDWIALRDSKYGSWGEEAWNRLIRDTEFLEKYPVIGEADADALKWMNDVVGGGGLTGQPAGDKMIDALVTSLREGGINAFRKGGDEISFVGKTKDELLSQLATARELYSKKVIAYGGKEYTGFQMTGGIASDQNMASAILRDIKKVKKDFREDFFNNIVTQSRNPRAVEVSGHFRDVPAYGVKFRVRGQKKWVDIYDTFPDKSLRGKAKAMINQYKKDLAAVEAKFKHVADVDADVTKLDVPGKFAGPGGSAGAEVQLTLFKQILEKIRPRIKLPTGRLAFDAERPIPVSVHKKLVDKLNEAEGLRQITEELYDKERSLRASKLYKQFEMTEGEEAVAAALETLRGAYPKAAFKPIGHIFNKIEKDSIYNHIKTHSVLDDKPITKGAMLLTMEAIMEFGHLPTASELSILNQIFGHKFTGSLLRHYPGSGKGATFLAEFLNAPRTLLTSYDLSAAGRQGFWVSLMHPRFGARAYKAQVMAMRDKEYSRAYYKYLTTQPMHKLRQKFKLAMFDPNQKHVSMTDREEFFISNIQQNMGDVELEGLAKILTPLKKHGQIVQASERAYLTFLNSLRANMFDLWANKLIKMGKNPSLDKDKFIFQELADFVNATTGRGKAGYFGGKWWSTSLFAPRFLMSGPDTVYRSAKIFFHPSKDMPWKMRHMAARHMVQGVSETMMMAGMIKMAGEASGLDVKFSMDPYSSDFGRLIINGRTRIDLLGRYRDIVRMPFIIIGGQKTNIRTGEREPLQFTGRVKAFFKYWHGKAAPIPSAAVSLAFDETPTYEKPTLKGLALGISSPILFRELMKINDEHGALGLLLLAPFAASGFPVGVYDIKKPVTPREAMQQLGKSMGQVKQPIRLATPPGTEKEQALSLQEALKGIRGAR